MLVGHRIGGVGPACTCCDPPRRCLPRKRSPRPDWSSRRRAGARGSAASPDPGSASPRTRAASARRRIPASWKILVRSRGLASSCHDVHLHARSGEAPAMNGACAAAATLRHLAQQLDVGRRVVEVVVADQAAERLAAELAVFLLVDLLEQRALVPGRALVPLERLAEILLARCSSRGSSASRRFRCC